jgi:hypothetical protein
MVVVLKSINTRTANITNTFWYIMHTRSGINNCDWGIKKYQKLELEKWANTIWYIKSKARGLVTQDLCIKVVRTGSSCIY